jgi:hypothetical protein
MQYSYNDVAQFCAQWWLDPVTNEKINLTRICYDMEYSEWNPVTSVWVLKKAGCAHKAPGLPVPAEGVAPSPLPENATWELVDDPADFVPDGLFNSVGLEEWDNRPPWYACNEFTEEGTAARATCKNEVIGQTLGYDVPTLAALARATRVCLLLPSRGVWALRDVLYAQLHPARSSFVHSPL